MAAVIIFCYSFFVRDLNHRGQCKPVNVARWTVTHPATSNLFEFQGHVTCSTNAWICVLNAWTQATDIVYKEEIPNHRLSVQPCRQSFHFQSPPFSNNKDWNRWLLWEPYVIQSCVSVSDRERARECVCQSDEKQLLTMDEHTESTDLHNQCIPRVDYKGIIFVFNFKIICI